MSRRLLLFGLFGLLGLAGGLGLVSGSSAATPDATGYVYWGNNDANTIDRANLDGTNVDQSFVSGSNAPRGVAVDAGHVYWTNYNSNTIGRANLDGTNVDQSFISGASTPYDVAVDAAHVYWSNSYKGTIGRANLDGTNVEQSFIATVGVVFGITVYAGHIYWTNPASDTIGRANLDGTNVEQSFISSARYPVGIAVDSRHIYWTNYYSNTISRADPAGANVNQSFIHTDNNPAGLAVDAGHLYWTNVGPDTIGRADLDGTSVDQSFLSGTNFAFDVAVTGSVTDSSVRSYSVAYDGYGATAGSVPLDTSSPYDAGDTVTVVDAGSLTRWGCTISGWNTRADGSGTSYQPGDTFSMPASDVTLFSQWTINCDPGPAPGYVYWTDYGNGSPGTTIGRANLDGTNADPSFIVGPQNPTGVAVDAGHVYWANTGVGGPIGRANVDGTNVDKSFITGNSRPYGVAVDAGHIYWTDVGDRTIGRADLDGTNVDHSFISGIQTPNGIAVDANHLYWTNSGGDTISRANLDGTNVDESFIGGATSPEAVAVDAGHIYWTNYNSNTIGRADLDGTNVDQSFIGDAPYVNGVAVGAGHVYWTHVNGFGLLGRADLDGTNTNGSFMSVPGIPYGVAVLSLPDVPTPPVDLVAAPMIESSFIRWNAPISNGSAPLTEYEVTATVAGGAAVHGAARAEISQAVGPSDTSTVLTGLTNGVTYSVTVTASNTYGSSATSTARVRPGSTYPVAYVGNGATGGSVPSDGSSPYMYGATVFVGGAGSLSKAGYSFSGWNTTADGSGTSYQRRSAFSMPTSAVTLYAQWSIKSYAVAYVGNGATGGSVPSDGSSPHGYGTRVTVLGAGSLTRTGYTFYRWNTAANGSGTSYSPGGTFKMPASAVTLYARWTLNLRTGTTTCRGTYSGTGSYVVVPAFATCTLVPGTHVKYSVTVKPGGTLHINGVKIGGTLKMSGSATVCGSTISGAVVATGGSLALGGPGCAGNTITGSVLVQHDANNVTVQGNKISGSLTVKYGTGATDSIVSNMVSFTLLVEYSGPPVKVSQNRAYTARCVNNKGQTGSGDRATSKNTCPR